MRICSLVLAILFIAGCATLSRPAIEKPVTATIDSFQIKGRLAAKIDNQGGSASFNWDKAANTHLIELYGPLGAGRVMLQQSDGWASVADNDGEISGADLEQVLYKKLGWLVPFDSLSFWILGLPDPNNFHDQSVYESETLTAFRQSGWNIRYDKFDNLGGSFLPNKLTLTATEDYLDQLSYQHNRGFENVSVKVIIKAFSGS